MEYKNYKFEIDSEELIPPIGDLHFAAKPTYMRSPKGKMLWRGFHQALSGASWGWDKKDAEEKAIEITKKWIDNQLKKEKNS